MEQLVEYLDHAQGEKARDWQWRSRLALYDFSSACVRLVASVPGKHKGADRHRWGHFKLRQLLQAETFAVRTCTSRLGTAALGTDGPPCARV